MVQVDSKRLLEISFEQWQTLLSDFDAGYLKDKYQRWRRLVERQCALEHIIGNSMLPLDDERELLQRSAHNLDVNSEYRIVLIGTTGAGKSSLINALIGRQLLTEGQGFAITGCATHIRHKADLLQPTASITFRDEQEMVELIRDIAGDELVEEPVSLTHAAELIKNGKLLKEQAVSGATAGAQQADIERAIDLFNTHAIGKPAVREYTKLGPDSRFRVLTDERLPESILPIIRRIDFSVPASEHDELTFLGRVVIIDTPGKGIRLHHHGTALLAELHQADAIVLVVGAERGDSDSASALSGLVASHLFFGLSDDQVPLLIPRLFLVMNKMDLITDDKNALSGVRRSLRGILQSIGISYDQLEEERRYFPVMAGPATLAQEVLKGAEIDTERDRRAFEAFAQLLLGKMTPSLPPTVIAERILDKSNIKDLKRELGRFIVDRRLDSTLNAAAAQHESLIRTTRFHCARILSVDGNVPSALHSDVDQINNWCVQALDQDLRSLKVRYRAFWEAVHEWRRKQAVTKSPSDGNELPSPAAPLQQRLVEIRDHLEAFVIERASALLSSEADPPYTRVGFDDQRGVVVTDAHRDNLLLDIEWGVKLSLEHEVELLADYYFSQFMEILNDHKLIEALEEKSYSRPYVIHPRSILESSLRAIQTEFYDMCKWVVVAHLSRLPILGTTARSDNEWTWPAVISDFFPSGLRIAFEQLVHPEATVLAQVVGAIVESTARSGMLESHDRPAFDSASHQKDQLEALEGALKRSAVAQASQIISQEFSWRIRLALAQSLPQVDSFFAYEAGKFRVEYGRVADRINRLLMLHVEDDDDLQRRLVGGPGEKWHEISAARAVLTSLDQLMDRHPN